MAGPNRLVIKLRQAMESYYHRYGERWTYKTLADRTGLSESTFESIGTNRNYNATLATIEKICLALDVTPGDLLELIPDPPPKSKRKRRKKTKRKNAGRS